MEILQSLSYCDKGIMSDVHVYQLRELIICHRCELTIDKKLRRDPTSVVFDERSQVLNHLTRHLNAGHAVPDTVINRLYAEMDLVGSKVTGQEEWLNGKQRQADSN